MPASAEHGISGWSFTMRLLSFRGALCQELDLELLGLRVQQMCSTTAMGYAVQVLVILVLPRAIMISRLSSSPLVLVTDTCTLGKETEIASCQRHVRKHSNGRP